MSLESEQTNLSPIKRALRAVEDMQAKLGAMEAAKREPIAILGMGCRFPGGVENPSDFWHLLRHGVDAITPVPNDRWNSDQYYDPDPDAPGKMYNREGGFLQQTDAFDPQFFGISAREATSLDPQHRLLLEVSWEALEDANQVSELLFNSLTGVFIGICANEYNKVMWDAGGATQIDAFCATGNALSVAAGRLSYALGLKGPSLAIDTACSSSLVAIHLACQQLRDRECHIALAGGVHLLLSPESSIAFARTRMLDPEGRCKTFDASANGYVRGEGCGVIVLKRLSDALADGDNILAVIRGSAVNHNGRSSSLIAPNGPAQQTVIRQALAKGKVDPAQVSYVEVQGTGTALGQPIEVGALEAVFGRTRSPEQPLMLGSVKTNIGHLEGASGIASLIKVVLSLQHREIPPNLHFKQPNPYIAWDELPFQVPTEPTPWVSDQPRLAGISSFGFSGTNAHLVLEEAPEKPTPASNEPSLYLLTLAAKTEPALTDLAKRYEKHLVTHPDLNLGDICFTANTGRSAFQQRLAILAESTSELCEKLTDFNAGQAVPELWQGKATTLSKIGFRFGQPDIQNLVIDRQLYKTQPMFREAIDRCDQILRPYLSQSLSEILYSPSAIDPLVYHAEYQLSALFALEYALFQLWKSWGIEPAIVIGRGCGELVAACVAGVFSLEDGLKLIAHRDNADKFEQIARAIDYAQPKIRFCSQANSSDIATPDYWCRQIQQSPDLIEADTSNQQDFDLLLDISPQSWHQILQQLGNLYVQRVKVNWSEFASFDSRHYIQLPTYAWQRKRYWVEAGEKPEPIAQTAIAHLLNQTNLEQIVRQLKTTANLSEDESQLLNKLMQRLIQNSDRQSTAASSSMSQAEPQLNKTSVTVTDIETWMINKIAKELGIQPEDVDKQASFDSYGLDSVLAINIASAGKQYLGIEVSPLMLMHYPTIASLSQHLAAEMASSDTELFEI